MNQQESRAVLVKPVACVRASAKLSSDPERLKFANMMKTTGSAHNVQSRLRLSPASRWFGGLDRTGNVHPLLAAAEVVVHTSLSIARSQVLTSGERMLPTEEKYNPLCIRSAPRSQSNRAPCNAAPSLDCPKEAAQFAASSGFGVTAERRAVFRPIAHTVTPLPHDEPYPSPVDIRSLLKYNPLSIERAEPVSAVRGVAV